MVNQLAVKGLKDPWRIPDDIAASADILVNETGVHTKAAPRQAADNSQGALAKKWKVRIIEYNNVQDVEESEAGVRAGLVIRLEAGAGLRRRRSQCARRHGDGEQLGGCHDHRGSGLVDHAVDADAAGRGQTRGGKTHRLYLSGQRGGGGAVRSDEDHLPNVTGVYNTAAYAEMLD